MRHRLRLIDNVPAVNTDQLHAALVQWQMWQHGQALSPNTVNARTSRVRIFADTLGVDPITATSDDVARYLATLSGRSTKATYFGHLRAWFRWLVRVGRRADDPTVNMKAPREPRRLPHPVSDDQLKRLLHTRMHKRTRMMILLAAFQGLRVHEIAKMRGEDVDLEAMTLTVEGKGGRVDVLPLSTRVASLAVEFPRRGWWFTTYVGNSAGATGGPILSRSVTDIVKDAMERAGVPGSAHWLRHWYGTKLVDSGVNMRVVQRLMRHSSLQTTQIYTLVNRVREREAMDILDLALTG